MSMPRYKYAIGNAPVRFPSPKPVNVNKETESQKIKDEVPSHNRPIKVVQNNNLKENSLRPSRWSMFSLNATDELSNEDSLKRVASQPELPSSSPERQRSKSMHGEIMNNNKSSRHQTKRVSWLTSSRDQSPSAQSSQSERVNLLKSKKSEEMLQNRSSTTLLPQKTLRPSSLFWTDEDNEGDKGKLKQKDDKNASRINSYGAIQQSKSSITNNDIDDPYGYRALAGPTLLPTFHLNRQQQGEENSTKFVSRTCLIWPLIIVTLVTGIIAVGFLF